MILKKYLINFDVTDNVSWSVHSKEAASYFKGNMNEGNYSTFVKQNIELDYIFNVIHY